MQLHEDINFLVKYNFVPINNNSTFLLYSWFWYVHAFGSGFPVRNALNSENDLAGCVAGAVWSSSNAGKRELIVTIYLCPSTNLQWKINQEKEYHLALTIHHKTYMSRAYRLVFPQTVLCMARLFSDPIPLLIHLPVSETR